MSSDDSTDDERECARATKVLVRRTNRWGEKGQPNTAASFLSICEEWEKIPEINRDMQLYDVFEFDAENIPPAELGKILEWFYTDQKKRNSMNTMLCCNSKYSPEGPEKYLARRWAKLSSEHRAVIKKHTRMDLREFFDRMESPDSATWDFLEEYAALLSKQ